MLEIVSYFELTPIVLFIKHHYRQTKQVNFENYLKDPNLKFLGNFKNVLNGLTTCEYFVSPIN